VRSDDIALSFQGSSRVYVIRGSVGDQYLQRGQPACSRGRAKRARRLEIIEET
jgi:hypothetical protein